MGESEVEILAFEFWPSQGGEGEDALDVYFNHKPLGTVFQTREGWWNDVEDRPVSEFRLGAALRLLAVEVAFGRHT